MPLLTKSNIIQDDNLLNEELIIDSYNKFLESEQVKSTSENNTNNNNKNRFDDSQRQGILKALSLYANQLYSNLGKHYILLIIFSYLAWKFKNNILDQKDTKKLETNLKSLSKFYNTLNDSEKGNNENVNNINNTTFARKKFYESSMTMQTLIEMAKEVSDKMIISKAQVTFFKY